MPVTNRTLCLLCDITRGSNPMPVAKRTPCLLFDTASCGIAQDAETHARNKSYPLPAVRYHMMQNLTPVTNRTP